MNVAIVFRYTETDGSIVTDYMPGRVISSDLVASIDCEGLCFYKYDTILNGFVHISEDDRFFSLHCGPLSSESTEALYKMISSELGFVDFVRNGIELLGNKEVLRNGT